MKITRATFRRAGLASILVPAMVVAVVVTLVRVVVLVGVVRFFVVRCPRAAHLR